MGILTLAKLRSRVFIIPYTPEPSALTQTLTL
jgi:hypothetical protein